PEEYRAFEDAIVTEYLPQTPVEQELVHRLALLFWRLRRASSIETGLLRMQSEILHAFRSSRQNAAMPSTGEEAPWALSENGAQIRHAGFLSITSISPGSNLRIDTLFPAPIAKRTRCRPWSQFALDPVLNSKPFHPPKFTPIVADEN